MFLTRTSAQAVMDHLSVLRTPVDFRSRGGRRVHQPPMVWLKQAQDPVMNSFFVMMKRGTI